MSVQFDKDSNNYIVECPHCGGSIIVNKNDIRCKIFRHASYKKDLKPIPPHSSKDVCQNLVDQKLVFGCAKPFKFDGEKVEICDYI